jgi:hypothetical protein
MKLAAAITISQLALGGPGSGCTGPNCGRPAGFGVIPTSEVPLTHDQDRVELKARRYLMSDLSGAKARYKAQFGNVLDADKAKELFPDYRADRSKYAVAVHEPSSYLIKQIFNDELNSPPPLDKLNQVLFTAGGAGAGKTTMIENNPETNELLRHAQVVYDGTGGNLVPKIDKALAAGKDVHVAYVHRDPLDAFVNGILPRAMKPGYGRTVNMERAADMHIASRNGIEAVADKYKDNPHVKLTVIDNSHGWGNAQISDLAHLPPITRDKAKLTGDFRQALEKEHNEGRVSDDVYKNTLGS